MNSVWIQVNKTRPSPLKPGGLYLGIVRDGAPWRKNPEGGEWTKKPGPSETYRIFSAEFITGEKGKFYSTLNNLFELLGKRREKIQFS